MLRKSSTGEYPVGNVLGVHTSSRFRYYFFYLIFRKYENNKIPKCTPFGMKCSKSRRLLGLRPRPRWGSLRRSLRPPSREGLLAFGNRSFAPSALALTPIFPISVPPKVIYRFTPLSKVKGAELFKPEFCETSKVNVNLIIASFIIGLCLIRPNEAVTYTRASFPSLSGATL